MNWILKAILLVIVIIFFSYLNIPQKKNTKEGFGGINTYDECRNQGFTKEYCLQTPVSVLGPGYCLCRNGLLGFREPGFRGRCVCVDDDIQII